MAGGIPAMLLPSPAAAGEGLRVGAVNAGRTPVDTEGPRVSTGHMTMTRACTVDDLRQAGVLTPSGLSQSVALFWHDGEVFAIDNRCPHMGFPLARGFCQDGVLTCYWHYARFDLRTGGTFDPWADDVQRFPVTIRDGAVFVDLAPPSAKAAEAHARERLREGLEQNISLVQAKAVLRLSVPEGDAAASGALDVVRTAARHGLRFGSRRNRAGWGDGLTILVAMARQQPHLRATDRPLALYHGSRRVAEDADGQRARICLTPLPGDNPDATRLGAWFREFVEVRDVEAAERTLRTAIAQGWPARQLLDLLAEAATDHAYRDFSHVMDTVAKVAELLDLVGWDEAMEVLPALTDQLCRSTREEEAKSWRQPEDLAGLAAGAVARLPGVVTDPAAGSPHWTPALVEALLGESATAAVEAVLDALRDGTSVAGAAQALAYASALRLARFPTSNEFADWDTALHSFTYCASLAQVARRAPSAALARGIVHGAVVVYQQRFLNIPPAPLPTPEVLAALPTDASVLIQGLLDACDTAGGVEVAARHVARYLEAGHDAAGIVAALGHAVLREDPAFHDFQMLEEGVTLANNLAGLGTALGRAAQGHVLVAIARWQAAHAPTRRATTQTYDIALRLHRGAALHLNGTEAPE